MEASMAVSQIKKEREVYAFCAQEKWHEVF
jgi:hypothetical protein